MGFVEITSKEREKGKFRPYTVIAVHAFQAPGLPEKKLQYTAVLPGHKLLNGKWLVPKASIISLEITEESPE